MVDQSTPTPPQMPAQQPSRPQQTANIITPKSKISMKSVAIGCGLLVLMVIGGLSIVFYNLMNNPTQLSSVGLDPSTTKTLLQTFSILFFGLLTFLGIGFLVINLYRVITVKNVSRLRYIFGAFFGFIIFMFAIVIGARIIILVNNFSVENIMDSDKLIMPYLQIKDDIVYTRGNDAPKLIAPATIYYELNPNYFRSIISTLGQVNFTDIVLDCGNGQKLPMDFVTYQFKGSCMYFQK